MNNEGGVAMALPVLYIGDKDGENYFAGFLPVSVGSG